MATTQTATGTVDTADLGQTLMHEHVMTRSPGVFENWPHLFDRAAALQQSERKLRELAERGIQTLVDLTTVDLGRDIAFIADVARRSPVRIIVATGVWWQPPRFFQRCTPDAAADLFIRDIRDGIADSGIRAAIIKVATDTEGVTRPIETVLRGAARAQKATGAPISTHTWAEGRMGEAQQKVFAEEGLDLSRVVIGHSGDSEDLDYLRGLMSRGSYIGMDRFGLDFFLTTEKRVKVIARLCAEGFAGQMVLSHDASCYSEERSEAFLRERTPRWHFNHIPDDVVPALRAEGVSDGDIHRMLVDNPRAIFEHNAPY